MNSLQSAGEGSVDLSKGPSLNGDPPGLKLGLDDGVRGSLYRDLRKDNDTYLLFNSIYSTVILQFTLKEISDQTVPLFSLTSHSFTLSVNHL